MKKPIFELYIEINSLSYIFFVGKINEKENFEIIDKIDIPILKFENGQTYDLEKTFTIIKENVYSLEQKINYTFKDVKLILEDFNTSFVNLSGYKKLNGSQILKENITYILNVLKSYIDENEPKKTILHIFNSRFCLDKKKIENLPIGLFGDFYSHELSFALIDTDDYKNLQNIFTNCNLKINKILLKSFVKGANAISQNKNIENFFYLHIEGENTKIFFFENSSLKFEEEFKFGINIVLRDISKITSLKTETVKLILKKLKFKNDLAADELVEEEFFKNEVYKKIRKKLIYDIIFARVEEMSELILFKNYNTSYFNKINEAIFLEFSNKNNHLNLKEFFRIIFSKNDKIALKFLETPSNLDMLKAVSKIVHFGWKKEAIPVIQSKKSLIARLFDALFG